MPSPRRRDNKASEFVAFARFLSGLPRLIRLRMTVAQAIDIINERLRNRERNFLDLAERSIYRGTGPYRKLLDHAGCTLGDLRELVERQSLEGALNHLRDKGVYVSFEEWKGNLPIVRGSLTIDVSPADFDNPGGGRYYSSSTGGSTGTGRRVQLDLDHFEALLPVRILVRHVQGITGIPAASWSDLPPGGGMQGILLHAAAGEPAVHWYCARMNGPDRAPFRFRAATSAALTVARLSGGSVMWPKPLPFDRAVVLAEWARDQVKRHGKCTIHASVSRILRIAIAAQENGIDLTGTVLRGGAEPPTRAKVAQITRTGATFRSSYGITEIGTAGSCCINATGPNDQHFMRDHLAMIQVPRKVPGFDVEVSALCFTSLLPGSPKLLLNVESDDYATVDESSCGCEWERLGFRQHMRDIRSFRKLTGEGVTLVGSDMERILDEVLPARYGGSALDYQFAEEEDASGFTRLVLRVSPSVALGSEQEAADFVLAALAQLDAGGALARNTWKQAGTLRIRRERPLMTGRGKLMPLDRMKVS